MLGASHAALLLWPLALAIGGCAAPALRVTGIAVAKDASFDLLSPSSLEQSVSLEQIVEARYGERASSFHCLLEVDGNTLVLVGMTPFNTRAFTLTLADDGFELDMAPGAELPADPSRILADLQLALWPKLSSLRGLTERLGRSSTGALMRELHRDGVPQIRITYAPGVQDLRSPWVGTLVFEHLEQNYALSVRTVRAERLAP